VVRVYEHHPTVAEEVDSRAGGRALNDLRILIRPVHSTGRASSASVRATLHGVGPAHKKISDQSGRTTTWKLLFVYGYELSRTIGSFVLILCFSQKLDLRASASVAKSLLHWLRARFMMLKRMLRIQFL